MNKQHSNKNKTISIYTQVYTDMSTYIIIYKAVYIVGVGMGQVEGRGGGIYI